MKSILILIVSSLLLTSCKEKDAIEVIPTYNEIDKVDSAPQLINGDEKKLSEEIKKEAKKLGISNIKLDYKLMLDENGDVKKVIVGRSPNTKFTDIVVREFETWKFQPGQKNGKAVKSQYFWKYYITGFPEEVNINKEEFLVETDESPSPYGGINKIQEKIKYPEIAKRAGIEGKVLVTAFIDENGNVVSTEILKGIGAGCDETAVNAIVETLFIPGKINSKPVKSQVTIPILFKL